MITRAACVAIDLINADKPPASLAFLAGACEYANVDYMCTSINGEMISSLSTDQYNTLYKQVKMQNLKNILPDLEQHFDNIVDNILQFNPDMVLVSLFSFMQYLLAQYFLKKLKTKSKELTVIAGGPGIYYYKDNITNGKLLLDQNLIDYYVLGEGDEVLPGFLKGNTNMLGLNSNKHKFESWVPQIEKLDDKYIIPSYKKIDLKVYQNLEGKDNTVLSINTSRGCVRSCSFCDVAKSWPKFKYRSGKHIVKEILNHHKTIGVVNFYLVDSLINGSLKSFKEFNQEMIKLKKEYSTLSKFSYNGMFIVRDKHTHTEELFKTMAEAGCESLAIGVETGSDRLRYDMNKKFTNVDLDHHLSMCQKYGIRNTFLMFTGYPTETKKDFELTLKMLHRYQKYLIDDTILGINFTGVYTLIPDTPVYDHSSELGIELIISDKNSTQINWINKNNPELTVQERILRDLRFRRLAAELRYPIPYSDRYLQYLQYVDADFIPVAD